MKILFLDIDDTLLDRKKRISEENREAIRQTVDAGNKVVICSGRPLSAVLPIAEQLGLNEEGCYAIAFNGAQIYDCFHQKSLVRETLTLKTAKSVFRMAQEMGIHAQTYDAADNVLVTEADAETAYYCSRMKLPFRVDENLPESLAEEPVKCLFISLDDKERLEALRARILEAHRGDVDVFFSNPYFLECVKTGVSKGTAIRRFCDDRNVPIADSVSAGDSENDLPMLLASGIGCAMANADEAVKAAADYVTERDCDHSGVAEIIRRFL